MFDNPPKPKTEEPKKISMFDNQPKPKNEQPKKISMFDEPPKPKNEENKIEDNKSNNKFSDFQKQLSMKMLGGNNMNSIKKNINNEDENQNQNQNERDTLKIEYTTDIKKMYTLEDYQIKMSKTIAPNAFWTFGAQSSIYNY